MSVNRMTVRMWTPDQQVLKTKAGKVIAEAPNGFFCLLPRHIDFVAELVPGIFSYTVGENEHFLAVDRGILVKCGLDVMVSSSNVIPGENLEELEKTVEHLFNKADQKEEELAMAMNQLEADFLRRFVEMNQQR